MQQEKKHPTHPFRNFLYTLWSWINLLAFVGVFLVLATPRMPYRVPLLIGFAALLTLALLFGVFRPLARMTGTKRR